MKQEEWNYRKRRTVGELIEWLQQFSPDTTVFVAPPEWGTDGICVQDGGPVSHRFRNQKEEGTHDDWPYRKPPKVSEDITSHP
jgi:hypothetical protein